MSFSKDYFRSRSIAGNLHDDLGEEVHRISQLLAAQGIFTRAAGDLEYCLNGQINDRDLGEFTPAIASHLEAFLGISLNKPDFRLSAALKEQINEFRAQDCAMYALHFLPGIFPEVPNVAGMLNMAFGQRGKSYMAWEDSQEVFEPRIAVDKSENWPDRFDAVNLATHVIAKRFGLNPEFASRHLHLDEGDEQGAFQNPNHLEFNGESSKRAKILTAKARALRDAMPIFYDSSLLEKMTNEEISTGPSRASPIRTGPVGRDESRTVARRNTRDPRAPGTFSDQALDILMLQLAPTLFALDPGNEAYMRGLPKPKMEMKLRVENNFSTPYINFVLDGTALSQETLAKTNHSSHITYIIERREKLLGELSYNFDHFARLRPDQARLINEDPKVRDGYENSLLSLFFDAIEFRRAGTSAQIIWPDGKKVHENLPEVTFGDLFGRSREKRETIRVLGLEPTHTMKAYPIGEGITARWPRDREAQYWERMRQSPVFTGTIQPRLLDAIVQSARAFAVSR